MPFSLRDVSIAFSRDSRRLSLGPPMIKERTAKENKLHAGVNELWREVGGGLDGTITKKIVCCAMIFLVGMTALR